MNMCFTNIGNTANNEAQGDTYFVKTGQLCIEGNYTGKNNFFVALSTYSYIMDLINR